MRFTLALHTDGKTYGVVVPDLPGCTAPAGKS